MADFRLLTPGVVGGVLTLLAVASGWPRAKGADEVRFDARTLFEQAVSSDLCLSADGSQIGLDRGELFEDDGPAAGYSYEPNEEKLTPGIWIRKELLIPNPQCSQATLLVGAGGMLQAVVNGQGHEWKKTGKAGNYWETFDLPPELLRAGVNEILLHGSGKVWIARDADFAAGSRERNRHPNRSAKSTDGGKTWDDAHLGADGQLDGEYYVRVFLDHFRPRGLLTLPVVDLGNLARQPLAPPVLSVEQVRIAAQATNVIGGKLIIRARSGTNLVAGSRGWSDWQDLGATGGLLKEPRGRFLQVAVEFSTSDPLKSPELAGVVIEAQLKRADDWTGNVRLVESHNETIVRSSLPFPYEPFDHPRLKAFREQQRLDDVVKGAKTEFELITRLAAWSSRQWTQSHLSEAYPAWDVDEILKQHTDGKPVGGFCQQYNVVLLQACESFGLAGRAVSIGPGDHGVKIRSGHEVVEIWSNDYRKWIYLDGNTGWYFVDSATEIPLSLWELRQRQLAAWKGSATSAVKVIKVAETRFDWHGLQDWPAFVELRLIPRSNFLAEKSPLPLNQGMRGWFWTGHHVWTDDQSRASLLYGNRICRRGNFEWTLNQSHYVLEATQTPGELRVQLDTETPGFDIFLASVDSQGSQPVASGFLWKLHAGQNRLEVRSRNNAGREGIPSRVVLEYR